MVIFKQGEKLLLQDSAHAEGGRKGTLYLTNTRIIFETTTGMISKKTEIALILPLSTVEDVKVEGLIGKKLAIQRSDERRGVIDKYKFSVSNVQGWETSIRRAVQSSE
ncbi:GRAM domain-containing protein [[Eubacterium] cellulosolvens]